MTRKILVIDDEQPTLKMFGLLLKAYGYDILTASNGQEGIEVFRENNPEIVLTDIKMPIMDGIEVLKNIKKFNPNAEVIVITGHGDMDLAVKALNLDATDFINKPVRREDLGKALERAEERLDLSRGTHKLISFEENGEQGTIRIRGNVTALTGPRLAKTFGDAMQAKVRELYVLFDESASINGAGLTTLAEQLRLCGENGIPVIMDGLSENFRTVFDMVGISNMVEFSPRAGQA